jgi:hypothetical protein
MENMGKGNKNDNDNREFMKGLVAGVPAILAGQAGAGWSTALLVAIFIAVLVYLAK